MRLTQLTDYAMRLLIYLAQHPQRLCTIAEVAGSYRISETHLMKITHQLGRAGWIVTTRGNGGGMRLAREPKDIGLGDVVRSMEPDFFVVECFSTGNSCMLTGTCKLTGVMDGALRSFMQHLDGHTLADILPAPRDAPVTTQVVRVTRPARARALQ
jgi:Rrf2 family nitric oxide-sensitive transcriptional repressor